MREQNKVRDKTVRKMSRKGRRKENLQSQESVRISRREEEHLASPKQMEDSVNFQNIRNHLVQEKSKNKKKRNRYGRNFEKLNLRGSEAKEINFLKDEQNSQVDEKWNDNEWQNSGITDAEKMNLERTERKEDDFSKDDQLQWAEKKPPSKERQIMDRIYLKKRNSHRTNMAGIHVKEVKWIEENKKEADFRERKSASFSYQAEKQENVGKTDHFFSKKRQQKQLGEMGNVYRKQEENEVQTPFIPSFIVPAWNDANIRTGDTNDKWNDRETKENTRKVSKVRDGDVRKKAPAIPASVGERKAEYFLHMENIPVCSSDDSNDARTANQIKRNQKKKQLQRNFRKKKEQRNVEEHQKKSSQNETNRYKKNPETEELTEDAFREKTKGNNRPKRLHKERREASSRLFFEDERNVMVHGIGMGILKKTISVAGDTTMLYVHGKVQEAEQENTAVESAYQTKLVGERMICHAIHASNRRKMKQNSRLQELDRNTVTNHRLRFEMGQEIEKAAEKYGMEVEPSKKSAIQRFWQKQKRKSAYQAIKRGERTAAETGKAVQTIFEKAKHTTRVIFRNHKGILGMAAIMGFLFLIFSIVLSGGGAMLQGASSSIIGTTYPSEDEEIYEVETDYTTLEAALNSQINCMELTHPEYDEYRYQIDEISHPPYQLISYLTVLYEEFTYEQVRDILPELFSEQYRLTVEERVEIRTRTETDTFIHPETGERIEEEREEEYEYRILCISLQNKGFDTVARSHLTTEQAELYAIYNLTCGNRDYLFDVTSLPSGSGGNAEGFGYEIPAEALSDEGFANLLHEAETYLGYPYVWGGASPSTGFDCSGFVSWVINHCGNGWSIGRQTVDGLLSHCAYLSPSEAKPGDLIFFQGTYDTPGASHVGIYVGNNQMIHCGNPVQYANLNTAYWQQHFYAYGRIE